MREVTAEDRVQLRTQQLVGEQIAQLVITCARLRAENDVLKQALASANSGGGTGDSHGSEQPSEQVN